MTPGAIHYVPLETLVTDPDRLLAVCGSSCTGADWTTRGEAVTCPECVAFVAVVTRLARRAVPTSPAPLPGDVPRA